MSGSVATEDHGCYKAHGTDGRRHFPKSAGLLPGGLTVAACRQKCGTLTDMAYSALSGEYCFCGNELPSGANVPDPTVADANGGV